jgi:hypothetical protein
VIRAKLPETLIASALKVPMFTVSSEKASSTGIPEMSFTENKEPDKESVTENSCP